MPPPLTPPPADALGQHLALCTELHALVLEENAFLQREHRPPDEALSARRRALLERLHTSVEHLRAASTAPVPHEASARREHATRLEQARAKILQILNLQKENEQLLLRHSLGGARPGRPAADAASANPPSAQLAHLYARHQPAP
jgi:hypothetical protein